MNSNTQIGIGRLSLVPDELLTDFQALLENHSVPHEIQVTEPQIRMSMEDYIPTALVVFLAKPFFDAFLKEAGKDTYVLLKQKLASLFQRANELPIISITSAGEKIANPHESSRIVSIYTVSSSGQRLKFLFPKNATEEVYSSLFESLTQLVKEDYDTPEKSRLSLILTPKRRYLQVLRYTEGRWILMP